MSLKDHTGFRQTQTSRYGERAFLAPPSREEGRALLGELRSATCRAAPVAPRSPLVVYGGGDMGRMARDYFTLLGHEIALVVDRNAEVLRADAAWAGLTIAHPDEVSCELKQTAQLVLCVATAPFKPLELELAAQGWTDIVPFYDVAESQRARHPLSNGWFARNMVQADYAATCEVLDLWDDDLSRAYHLQFLAWRIAREEWTFDGAPIEGHNRFFIPEIIERIDALASFVDGGAHHGQVSRKFADLRGLRATSVVAIEPDPANLAAFDCDGAEVYPLALGATAGERSFHAGLGYASQFAASGANTLPCVTLDSLDLAPDFIKLHLEGGELAALKGALETIQQHRPVLAITTYHNADGIWRTPAWLMEKLDGYRFLMRVHSWCGTGAVVYALPEERA
ncbi:FkbM family methyltransferase [Aurantiacibacter suaedae]|uniref:FkbM family methyltransferase n=1 Tax=Aurantiacibacter suaedae TaxID=2545755 RepID=UPI0010F523B9|nr:FkbM family methyltransferase [Aurantiacibacter suaedae]